MPPAIIAAAVGIAASAAAAAGVITLTAAMVITIAASAAAALLTKTKVPSLGAYTSQQERKQVLRSSSAPQVYIYGRTMTSGLLFFAEEEKGDQEKEWVHLAITLAAHEIDAVETIYLGDEPVGAYGNLVTWELHNNRQTADPFMLEHCQSWKPDMIGKGIAWLRISLKFDQEKFPAGLPNIKIQLRGKKVYDPRTQQTAWSDNAALCILDFYKNVCNVSDAETDLNQFIQAANISDQIVAPNSYKRYTINGAFDLTDAQSSVLDDLHKACAGEPTYMAGRHGLLVGAYYGPATLEIHPGQIVSDVKIVPEAAYNQKLNTVTGTFTDPDQLFTEVDYPPVFVQQYIDEDGFEFTDDLKLRFVSNVYQAQQLAQLKINRTRVGRSLQFTMNLSGYQYRPGYYVKLFLPQLGINGQEFRITEWDFAPNGGVNITLKQETATVWADAIGKPIDRPDITDFPSATVPQPVNLLYTVTEIGEVVQGVLSWTNIGPYSYNIVNVRQNGKSVLSIQVPGNSTPLTGLVRGSYDVGVIAVSALGARSVEAFTQITINSPDAPVSCEVGQGYFEITLKPKLAQIQNVSTQFDFWTSGETRLSDSSTVTVETNATRAGIGQIWTSEGLKIGHTYYWYIRSINAFGSSAFLEVAALCDSDVAGIGDIIDEKLKDSDAFKSLEEPVRVSIEAALNNSMADHAIMKSQYAQLGPIKASVMTVTTTVADMNQAFADYKLIVDAQFQDNDAKIAQNATAISTVDQSLAGYKLITDAKFTDVDSDIGTVEATVGTLQTSVANNTQAIGTLQQQTTATINGLQATVDTKMTSVVTNDGTAKATFALNLGVNRNSVWYGAGMAMSVEPDGGGYKSTTLFKSQNFGIYSGSDPGAYKLAFAVYNGQTYIDDAMIRDASIGNAKIGGQINSYNWNGNDVGWCINKDGWATFNNVTVRGTIYGNDGYFNGTIRAAKIDGDVCAVWTFPQMSIVAGNGRSQTLYWRGGLNYPARICIPYSSISMGVSRPDNQFRAQLTINGVVMFDETFNNTASTLRNVVGYVDVPAGAVNVPITVNVWKVQGGQTDTLYFTVNRFTVIVSPATDRFFS